MDSSVVTDGIDRARDNFVNKGLFALCIPRSRSDVNKHKYTCTVLSCAL